MANNKNEITTISLIRGLYFLMALNVPVLHALCGRTNLQQKKSCRNEKYSFFPVNEFLNDVPFIILDVGNTGITDISTREFLQLPYRDSIKILFLDSNQLSVLPPRSFAELNGLTELNLSSNNFTYINTALCHIPTLEVLILDNNPIKGFHPNAFKCLPNLKILSLKYTSLSELPDNFLHGTNVKEVYLDGNYITNINDWRVPKSIILMTYGIKSNGEIDPTEASIKTTQMTIPTTRPTIITTLTTAINEEPIINYTVIATINSTKSEVHQLNDTSLGTATIIIVSLSTMAFVVMIFAMIIIIRKHWSMILTRVQKIFSNRNDNVEDDEDSQTLTKPPETAV